MTVQASTARNDYVGSGTTGPFAYTYRIFASTDLVVTTQDLSGNIVTLAYLTGYTVSGAGNLNGGNVTLAVALTSGWLLTIRRVLAYTQPSDFRNQGEFFPADYEDAVDRTVMIEQQQQEEFNRALKVPVTDPGGDAVTTLPAASVRANKFLAFDGSGNVLATLVALFVSGTVAVSTFMSTVLAATTAAAARVLLGNTPLTVTNIAALKALAGSDLAGTVLVKGYYAAGDGGGGPFIYNAADASTDNGGTVIQPTVGSGRWNRVVHTSISLRDFGAKGDNSTDDAAFFAAIMTWATALSPGGCVRVTTGTYKIGSSQTVPTNVTLDFAGGGVLSIQNAVTITMNGAIFAPAQQIFKLTGTGKVQFGSVPPSTPSRILVKWWGALGDNTTDDTAAIQAAINALPQDGAQNPVSGAVVVFSPGKYKTTGTITINTGCVLEGDSRESVNIQFTHATADCFNTTANPDWLGVRNLGMNQLSAGGTGTALNFNGGTLRTIEIANLEVSGFKFGMNLINTVQGTAHNVRINGPGNGVVGSIGLNWTGNGFLATGIYINNYETGHQTFGGAGCWINLSYEANATAVKHLAGSHTWIQPWFSESAPSKSTVVDFNLQAGCTLFGYGSMSWKVSYLNSTIKSRVSIISTNDRDVGNVNTIGEPAGIKLGDIVLRTQGLATYLTGKWIIGGGMPTVKTAAYQVKGTDDYVEGDVTAASFSFTLPTITATETDDMTLKALVGFQVQLKRIDGSANQLNYAPSGADTIDGTNATKQVGVAGAGGQWGSVTLRAVALATWRIVGVFP